MQCLQTLVEKLTHHQNSIVNGQLTYSTRFYQEVPWTINKSDVKFAGKLIAAIIVVLQSQRQMIVALVISRKPNNDANVNLQFYR